MDVLPVGEVIAAYYRAQRGHDPEALARLLADDVVTFDPVSGPALEGREQVVAALRSLERAVPDLAITEDAVFVSGDGAAVRWSGRLATGAGHDTVEGVTVFEVDARGLIKSIWGYWDPSRLESLMGAGDVPAREGEEG